MGVVLRIALYDWGDESAELDFARNLSELCRRFSWKPLAVVSENRLSSARDALQPLGFDILGVPERAPLAERKNVAIGGSEADVLLLSSHLRPDKLDVLRDFVEGATEIDGLGVAGLKLVDANGIVQNAGFHVIRPEFYVLDIGAGKKDVNQYYHAREVHGVDSRLMLVSREAISRAGSFDTGYSGGYEDIDFCLKVREKGLKVLCLGTTKVRIQDYRSRATADERLEESAKELRSRWSDFFESQYETRVMWHSWINAPTGYAVSSQYLVLALESLNVDVRYGYVYGVEEPPNDDERIMEVRRKPKDLEVTQVVYGQGDVFFKNSGRYKVGYSMLEVTGIPEDWVHQANALDEIWVPSEFNRETFKSSGVRKPIFVMPLGVDTDHFHPFIESMKLTDGFVFLSVFEWGERKAPEVLLKAYNREFSSSDDVLLLLKIINTDPSVNVQRQIEEMRLNPDGPPVIIIQNQNVPAYQMGVLYRSADCFVLPTRGEGWGMPILEAMACGLPAISTYWSAQTEFLSDEVAYPLKVKKLVRAVAKCPYYQGFEWAEPDIDHLMYLMRYVYENREEARARGMRAAIRARQKWTWSHAAMRIKNRLLEISD